MINADEKIILIVVDNDMAAQARCVTRGGLVEEAIIKHGCSPTEHMRKKYKLDCDEMEIFDAALLGLQCENHFVMALEPWHAGAGHVSHYLDRFKIELSDETRAYFGHDIAPMRYINDTDKLS